ncbi:MAG: hypothetical protein ACE5GM_07220, partial [bacterium]
MKKRALIICLLGLTAACSPLVIPSEPGVVVTRPVTKGISPFSVICITERHASASGQLTQLKLLKDFLKQVDSPLLIGIEGGVKGVIDTAYYVKYREDPVWRPFFLEETESELRQGKLSAAEYLALTQPDKVRLAGLENPEEYQKAIGLYKKIKHSDFMKFHKELNPLVLHIFPRLNKQGQRELNRLLKSLDK